MWRDSREEGESTVTVMIAYCLSILIKKNNL